MKKKEEEEFDTHKGEINIIQDYIYDSFRIYNLEEKVKKLEHNIKELETHYITTKKKEEIK